MIRSSLSVAVLIATKDRYDLLTTRAIPSVVRQTRRPDLLVIVDDSSPDIRTQNATYVASLSIQDCEVLYVENRRSEGASGSWNTGIDTYLSKVKQPESAYIAILDDDDSWLPTYLELCCRSAFENHLDMVAADFRRFEVVGSDPLIIKGADELKADDFLTTNPGIQGSNLFLRLSMLLAAGGFDEELRSATDRDLCVRLADLGAVRYGRLPITLVDHFADSTRPRLSARGSETKLDGLTTFWKKYSGRMTPDQISTFSRRAKKLFNWQPTYPSRSQIMGHILHSQHSPELAGSRQSNTQITEPLDQPYKKLSTWQISCQAPMHEPFSLYVGVITSDPLMLRMLISSILPILQTPSIKSLYLLILNNGAPPVELEEVARVARLEGLMVAIVSESQQRIDASRFTFGKSMRVRPDGRVGIAQARTMLQKYLGGLLADDRGSIGWILDDDMRVDDRAAVYLQWLPSFREQGVDVLLGAYEGSSPNPPLNGLRVQLVDLFHNLVWLNNLPDEAVLPDRSDENAFQRKKYPEYYYDLSRRHTGHLEMPHWLEPAHQNETVVDARSRLIAGAANILSGRSLTRPLVSNLCSNPLKEAVDSVNRGGCTFVLNADALIHTPNMIIKFRGCEARRSDMIWAIVNRYYRGLTIKSVSFPVYHHGGALSTPSFDSDKVQAEIIGSALYASLTEFLASRPQHRLNFSLEEISEIQDINKAYIGKRLLALEESFCRIAGLGSALRAMAPPGTLIELLDFLQSHVDHNQFLQIQFGVRSVQDNDIQVFLTLLRSVADDFSFKTADIDFISSQLCLNQDRE